jgi:hypothetical protein
MKKDQPKEVEYVWMCGRCSLAFEPTREADGRIAIKVLTRTATEDSNTEEYARLAELQQGPDANA